MLLWPGPCRAPIHARQGVSCTACSPHVSPLAAGRRPTDAALGRSLFCELGRDGCAAAGTGDGALCAAAAAAASATAGPAALTSSSWATSSGSTAARGAAEGLGDDRCCCGAAGVCGRAPPAGILLGLTARQTPLQSTTACVETMTRQQSSSACSSTTSGTCNGLPCVTLRAQHARLRHCTDQPLRDASAQPSAAPPQLPPAQPHLTGSNTPRESCLATMPM